MVWTAKEPHRKEKIGLYSPERQPVLRIIISATNYLVTWLSTVGVEAIDGLARATHKRNLAAKTFSVKLEKLDGVRLFLHKC